MLNFAKPAMYQQTNGESLLRLSDNFFVSPEDENYKAWLAAGNKPLPAPEPPAPPAPPTAAQKLAAAGLSVVELKELLGLSPRAKTQATAKGPIPSA